MEVLKLRRKTERAAFTRLYNQIDEAAKHQTDISQDIDSLATLQLLQEKNEVLLTLNNEIMDLLLAEEEPREDVIEKETSSADEYSLKFKKANLLLYQKAEPIDNDSHSIMSESSKRKFKLPRLELKKFGGEIRDWLSFWGQFQKIDEDPDIDEADKFQYLIQATIPNTRARELVESFPPSSGNYAKAIDCLKSRFGREDFLVEYYVRELLKLTLVFNTKEVKLSTIYDSIETQLRSLETLNVTTSKYAAMLFPLVESCLTENVLRTWQRSGRLLLAKEGETEESRLDSLMKFLKNEVESEGRIELAMQGFSLKESSKQAKPKKELPTAAGLFAGNRNGFVPLKCAFCDKGNHESKDCHFARNLDLNERMARLKKCGCCYKCLKPGHVSRKCNVRLSCGRCERRHCLIMCPDVQGNSSSSTGSKEPPAADGNDGHLNSLANPTCLSKVFLQTLVVLLRGETEDVAVRALIDTGSHKSYITKEAAERMRFCALKETTLIHTLFGGIEKKQKHLEYKVYVSDISKSYHCTFNVLDQERICSEIHQTTTDVLMQELVDNGIRLSDQDCSTLCSSTIHLLIGADIAGKLMTGKILNFPSGITAIETLLGWTLLGKSSGSSESDSCALMVTNLLLHESTISDLWKLETIGISDPAESKDKTEIHQDTVDYFQRTLTVNKEGRYEVALPWVLESSRLPEYRQMAEKRLNSVYSKLKETGKLEEYTDVFKKWSDEGIIEEIEDKKDLNVHYLPHRPVFKDNSTTTKVRPVFDASAHLKNAPSLNACLEAGPNLIELVPSLLNRFRKFAVGVTSDIEKAFLQISIREKDRNYLRFLWKTHEDGMQIYRHCRVVFGISCSPFLLASTLNHHIENCPEVLSDTAQILRNSFYVDNCVCSLKSIDEANKFIFESKVLMSSGRFNLRGWQSNADLAFLDRSESLIVPLLGLNWNIQDDTLTCIINCPKEEDLVLTKRTLLSVAQSIFDPLGIFSPVTIMPKFLLQESWILGLKWDDVLSEDLCRRFLNWLKKVQYLSEVTIPRWIKLGQSDEEAASLHVFCDASAKAYATCIFLRVELLQEVTVRFVQSRARVSPLKNITIPRLELLACCIGARLGESIVKDLRIENLKVFYWTDSSTALHWIRRDSPWGTFVWNRVKEIRTLTDVNQWRHIPGKLNPADLPSRGCTAEQFVHLKWWEGPTWLYEQEKQWPQNTEVADEDLINAEKRKTVLSTYNHTEVANHWYLTSSHPKTVRKLAWIRRFCNNCRKINVCLSPTLSCTEIKDAENLLMLMIQKEVFDGATDARLHPLNIVTDQNGLLRVKTRIVYRQDTEDFRYPIILPGDHPAVVKLILYNHERLMHCGNQILLARLREKYWILKGRKSIRKILNKCVRCKRFNAKSEELNLPPLPEDRVSDAGVFEVVGVDIAGPLFLRDGSKAWIALFTCAVFRGIHLELLSSMSTESFLLALRRFISRRGSPSVIFSDNGTNFKGASRVLRAVDWNHIKEVGLD